MENHLPSIRIVDLSTGYGHGHDRKIISEHLDGELKGGELTCLLGPNGAGKSTLLKTLAGFQPQIEGEIKLGGVDVGSLSRLEKSRLFGVVLTDRLMLDNTTVEELVALGRSPFTGFWGRLTAEDSAKVERALNLVGISGLAGRRVSTLSDGERQKAMIAKVLAQNTPFIFLDEPTAFLDYPGKVELLMLLRRLAREEDKMVFLSTHDLEIALKIADRVWLLDRSHGLTTGTTADLAKKGDFNRYFGLGGTEFDPTAFLAGECR